MIRALHADGALSHVIVDETRPLLQGARLTCWELGQLGIEHRLACDGAAPFLISQGLADAVVVGADRVAANGDVANKIGTYGLALAAHRAGIPFLVAAPESTLDEATPSGRRSRSSSARTMRSRPGRPGGDQGAQLRVRHHPGRARHGCGHGEEADNEGRSKLNWLWASANPQARYTRTATSAGSATMTKVPAPRTSRP